MTIDKALDEISGSSAEAKEESQKKGAPILGENLVADANAVIGEILYNFYSGDLPGQERKYDVSMYECAIRNFGMRLFKIEPGYETGSGGGKLLSSDFSQDIDKPTLEGVIRILAGDYIFSTDLAQLVEVDKIKELKNYVTEFAEFASKTTNFERRKKRDLAASNIYITIMSIPFEHRPISTLAARMAIEANELKIDSYSQKPPTKHFLKAAEKYGIKEIIPAMDALNNAIEVYRGLWK